MVRIAHIVLTEVSWLYEAGLLHAAAREIPVLPPRTRYVLFELVAGRPRKQIAADLGLSSHTVNDHESNRQPEPGRNAESTLQSAARQLGGTAEAGRSTQAGQRRILQGRQERDLEIWAKEVRCWLNAETALRGFIKGGEEHRTLRGDQVYHKATYPGKCGFTVTLANGQPTLTHALPAEYLERLLLANQTFHDDIWSNASHRRRPAAGRWATQQSPRSLALTSEWLRRLAAMLSRSTGNIAAMIRGSHRKVVMRISPSIPQTLGGSKPGAILVHFELC